MTFTEIFVGTNEELSIEEFCKRNKLEYIGKYAKKNSHEFYGEIVKLKDKFYQLEMDPFDGKEQKSVLTILNNFSFEDLFEIQEDSIQITVWPEHNEPQLYAFKEAEKNKAIEFVNRYNTVDIFINSEQISRDELYQMGK